MLLFITLFFLFYYSILFLSIFFLFFFSPIQNFVHLLYNWNCHLARYLLRMPPFTKDIFLIRREAAPPEAILLTRNDRSIVPPPTGNKAENTIRAIQPDGSFITTGNDKQHANTAAFDDKWNAQTMPSVCGTAIACRASPKGLIISARDAS